MTRQVVMFWMTNTPFLDRSIADSGLDELRMVPMNKKYILMLLLIIIIISCTACSANDLIEKTVVPQITLKPTVTEMRGTPSTAIAVVTATPKPTLGVTLISTPISYNLTPVPLFSETEKAERILGLIKTNNGCDLPCWWGITPGLTDWQTANEILEPISELVGVRYKEALVNNEFTELRWLDYQISVPGEVDQGLIILTVRGDVVEKIAVDDFDKTQHFYSIDWVLAELGEPDEIWFYGRSVGYDDYDVNIWLVTFGLIYQNRSTEVIFYTNEAPTINQIVTPCFGEKETIFNLYSPNKEIEFDDFINEATNKNILTPEVAIGMDTDTFYQTFLDPDASFCFEIPTEILR